MRRYLPGRREVAIFAVLALACAAVVVLGVHRDLILAALSVPLFIFAAVLGMYRTGRLTSQPCPVPIEPRQPQVLETVEAAADADN